MGILDITPDHEMLGISDILDIKNLSYVSDVFFKRFDFNNLFSQKDLAEIQKVVAKLRDADNPLHAYFDGALKPLEAIFEKRLVKFMRKKFKFDSHMLSSTFNSKKGTIVTHMINPYDKNWLRSTYFSCEYQIHH